MPPSLSWKFSEKEFTEQVKDVKLFVKCIQAITLNHSPLLCGFASLREISMSDFRQSGLRAFDGAADSLRRGQALLCRETEQSTSSKVQSHSFAHASTALPCTRT
jgi:hypothetical protein